MDFKAVSAVLAVLCVVLAVYAVIGVGAKTVYVNSTIYPKDDLTVSYLYPLRCVSCDLNKPGQCDFCNSYYDDRMMDLLSQEVGVPVKYYVSDVVTRPNVLVQYKEKATLGDARTRYNIAHTLCQFASVQKSCDLFLGEIDRINACVKKYSVTPQTTVYHTNSKTCTVCSKTDAVVEDLRNADYNDTTPYSVYTADQSNGEQSKFISDCMQGFDNVDYVPQLLCPATGKDLTGEFTLSQARDFADQCIEAK